MIEILDHIQNLQTTAKTELEAAATAQQLEAWRVTYIGRKGKVREILEKVSGLSAEEKKVAGKAANELRTTLHALYEAKAQPNQGPVAHIAYDPTTSIGHIHPLTLTMRRINSIFSALGFTEMEGPEIEDVAHSFDYLNIPLEHPARSESDTFYLEGGNILRVQTSSMQVRAVKEHNLKPPFKLLFPGRVFRSERTDATHETTFHQFEGLCIGPNVTIADYKGVIETFFSTFFQKEVSIRLRPSYFPFVEPGFEVDISCVFCGAQGCRVCKQSGWIEVMGAGMVHPNVLNHMGIDPENYQGYAFGGAIDRLTMLRHSINDIRLFWSGDVRFLRQFS